MPDEKFLEELRQQLSREYDRKDRLDSKSNTIMTISGTVATLLLAVGTFFLEKLKPEYQYASQAIYFLTGGVILIVVSILLSVLAHQLRSYTYPFGAEDFFDKKGVYNKSLAERFRLATDDLFYKRMIEEYLFSIKENAIVNDSKAKFLNLSHVIFFSGIFAIIALVIILVHAFSIKAIG